MRTKLKKTERILNHKGEAIGRQPKLTPIVQQRIVSALKAGNYRKVAAQFGGVSHNAFYTWMAWGREAESGPFKEFHDSVLAAEAEAETRAVHIIQKAALDGDWHAAKEFLARKYPRRWGKRVAKEISGPKGRPIEVEIANVTKDLSIDELRLLKRIRDRLAEVAIGRSGPSTGETLRAELS